MKIQRAIPVTPILASLFLSLLIGRTVAAQENAIAFVGQSDLVFHGVVQRIEYRQSNPGGPEGTSVPYTYVTYAVKQVIRGQAAEEVTLRFIGGLDPQSGLYLKASHSP